MADNDQLTTEAQLNAFLLEIAGAQRDRVRKLVNWLTKAEERILDTLDLDNLTVDQFPSLAKSVAELQKVTADLIEMIRKTATTKIPLATGDLAIEELAHQLATLTPDEVAAMKKWILEERPQLKLPTKTEVKE